VPRDTSPRRAGRLSTGLALAFVVALSFAPGVFSRHVLPAIAPYLPGADIPPRGVEAADSPLGQPPAVAESDAYELYETPPGSAQPFLAYDPCRPIHYVVRPDNAPPGSDTIIQEAIAEVSAASGLQNVLTYPDGRELVRAVIIHELGHVLGLAHVDDPEQLMYAGANDVTSLADGDRAGLALLGTGPCVPEL
jgi:hypothetical protein